MLGSTDYVFAAQPVLPLRHHMISFRGLSLDILVFLLSTPSPAFCHGLHTSSLWETQQASSWGLFLLERSHFSSPRLLRIRKGSRSSLTEFVVACPNFASETLFHWMIRIKCVLFLSPCDRRHLISQVTRDGSSLTNFMQSPPQQALLLSFLFRSIHTCGARGKVA
ncbi:hypothetical protein GGI43DRAFT_114853 [Trichoderma evansii]